MQIKTIILILLFPLSLFSQKHRFIYSYQFVPDSTNLDNIIIENTRLEIFKDHSEFLSDIVAIKDSAISSAIQKNQSQSTVKFPDGQYKNNVYKSRDLFFIYEYIGIQPFKVSRGFNYSWKLINETKKIQGYNCQKATLILGGRNWEAWFTKEIPIHDGPYVFRNLPGLIVQIKDTKNQHIFLLVGNFKVENDKTNFVDKKYFTAADITFKQFNKKWNIFIKNPLGATEQFMIMNPGVLSGKSFDNTGNEIDVTQRNREEQKYVIKHLKQNNNYLDLDLYKIEKD